MTRQYSTQCLRNNGWYQQSPSCENLTCCERKKEDERRKRKIQERRQKRRKREEVDKEWDQWSSIGRECQNKKLSRGKIKEKEKKTTKPTCNQRAIQQFKEKRRDNTEERKARRNENRTETTGTNGLDFSNSFFLSPAVSISQTANGKSNTNHGENGRMHHHHRNFPITAPRFLGSPKHVVIKYDLLDKFRTSKVEETLEL